MRHCAFCAGVPGSASVQAASVRPAATGTNPATATTASASVFPERSNTLHPCNLGLLRTGLLSWRNARLPSLEIVVYAEGGAVAPVRRQVFPDM